MKLISWYSVYQVTWPVLGSYPRRSRTEFSKTGSSFRTEFDKHNSCYKSEYIFFIGSYKFVSYVYTQSSATKILGLFGFYVLVSLLK